MNLNPIEPINPMGVSLPRFLKENPGMPPYGAICLRARTSGVPGIVKAPSGYGWSVTDPIAAIAALPNHEIQFH